jgi:hypothetical protein
MAGILLSIGARHVGHVGVPFCVNTWRIADFSKLCPHRMVTGSTKSERVIGQINSFMGEGCVVMVRKRNPFLCYVNFYEQADTTKYTVFSNIKYTRRVLREY